MALRARRQSRARAWRQPRVSPRKTADFRVLLVGPCLSRSEASQLRASLARLGSFDGVIAIDGGVRSCRSLGVKPSLAIGDWDSLGYTPRSMPQITLPRDKDWSDLSIACQCAIEAGAAELVIVGVTGGRPDQNLATLLDLSALSASQRVPRSRGDSGKQRLPVQISVMDLAATYHFVSAGSVSRISGGSRSRPGRTLELKARRGQIVSVFAMNGPAQGVTLDGFAYPLRRARLEPSSHGMSNRALRARVRISVERGTLLVMALK